jgi:hypothetical protein
VIVLIAASVVGSSSSSRICRLSDSANRVVAAVVVAGNEVAAIAVEGNCDETLQQANPDIVIHLDVKHGSLVKLTTSSCNTGRQISMHIC